MKRVLVTGANGYIGRHVVNELIDRGFDVYASDIKFNNINKKAKIIDISIFDNNIDIFKETGSPDICIHLAWRDGFIHNSENHILDLHKHYNFIKNMIAGGLKHIAIMGSMHEVGYWEGAIDEDTPTNPLSLYAIAKNSLRQMIEVLIKENDVIFQWMRGFYIIGDDLNSNSIFSKIYKAKHEGKKTFPFTTGKNKYDFISLNEFVNQIVSCSTQEEITGIINCCSGKAVSLAEKVEEFIDKNNLDIRLEYGAFPDRPYDSPAIWGDNSKIKQIIKSNTLVNV